MGFVYLINIQNTDIYKIGYSSKIPRRRMRNLQTGNQGELVVVKTFESDEARKVEKTLHNIFHHKKYTDDGFLKGEWFKLEVCDVLEFMEKCKGIEENILFIKRESSLFNKDILRIFCIFAKLWN